MIRYLFILLIIGFIAAIGFGFLGFLHPALDTFANFRVHLSIALIIMAFIWAIFSGVRLALIPLFTGALGLIFSIFLYGDYFSLAKKKPSTQPIHTLLHLNLFYQNQAPDKVIKLVDRLNPDIILFNEMSESWKRRLTALDTIYPYTFYCPEWRQIGGNKIYSRYPQASDDVYCHSFAALALMDIAIDGQTVTIGSVHLRWPWPASGPRQVDRLEPILNQLGPSAIIAGDFNSVPWSWLVRRFAGYGKLQIAGGVGATWLHQLLPISWVKFIGLPIDNVTAKGTVELLETRALEAVGSDHLPVLVRFSIKQ